MENVNITATTQTDKGLDYNNPNVQYSPGDTISVGENMDIHVNGEIKSVFVEYLEIIMVDIEYVVSEKEWYVNYSVGHYTNNDLITVINLGSDDIEAAIN